ncbi:hypothetical protein L873DRAFT_62156 [Choiromyces venosus 120613-1]|uniref:F-box domain-containing protein n=1 Tax=Choiromyces venosus 120613-1 TaxID=1336337 RepID=A0A3N4J562_9PEZI|nr:hypothetical protein L873DRAFT_62156 [Choiromyces venosus 120613-1]
MTGQIPPYLLVDILRNLNTKELLKTQSVSKTFHEELTTRALLRRILFTLPPTLSPAEEVPGLSITYDLHPVFRLSEYIPGPTPLCSRVLLRDSGWPVSRYPVCLAFACAPACTKVEVELCGAVLVVEGAEGVSVFGVLEGLDALMNERHANGRLCWDSVQFPFAGFRTPLLPSTSGGGSSPRLIPEFHNLPEITRQLSHGKTATSSLITFEDQISPPASLPSPIPHPPPPPPPPSSSST